MGLDMYLTKKTYVLNWDHNPEKFDVTVKLDGKEIPHIKKERIMYVEEKVAYWRKANAIHKWFVENVQDGNDDCGEYYVSREQLSELIAVCTEALNVSKPAEVLPTTSGFFFGSTDYDEWYEQDLRHTIETLSELLQEEGGGDFYYSSSW